jgi:hypothetical protein
MTIRSFVTSALACLAIAITITPSSHAAEAMAANPPAACTLPTSLPSGPYNLQQLAWQFFTAANCTDPTGKHALAWESWADQDCLNGTIPDCKQQAVRSLHPSVLSVRLAQARGVRLPALSAGDCSAMTTEKTQGLDPAMLPFIPKNLSKTRTPQFCEEVHVDQSEADYITSPGGKGSTLQTLTGQNQYVHTTGPIGFPGSALELKADWLPADSLEPGFDCDNNKPVGVYVEKIKTLSKTACYALVGIHITSKLKPNWVWATFEPQNLKTNPNRCNPNLYSSCEDPWGSDPASSTGQSTNATAKLKALMKDAGLPAVFGNYRLVGVQSEYIGNAATGERTFLGNSFVEFNAGVSPGQASCITCHANAVFNGRETPPKENPHFGPFPDMPAVGMPAIPANWTAQDFSWLLGTMPASK